MSWQGQPWGVVTLPLGSRHGRWGGDTEATGRLKFLCRDLVWFPRGLNLVLVSRPPRRAWAPGAHAAHCDKEPSALQ